GGAADTAHYEMVGTNTTGHAESVQITFDPRRISYGQMLQIYFSVAHNPTELNRQGPDVGSQYRSAIFPTNPQQMRIAEAYIVQLKQAHVFDGAIVTKTNAMCSVARPPLNPSRAGISILPRTIIRTS